MTVRLLRPRALPKACLSAFVATALAGCASVVGAGSPLEDRLDVIGGPPKLARDLRGLPLEAVARGPSGWNWYEIGRRFEEGDRVPRDLTCAVVFYERAAASPYASPEPLHGFDFTVTRVGVPFARVALRRLSPIPAEARESEERRCLPLGLPGHRLIPAGSRR